MRLKSIKLAGFKSFVDPTTVPFTTNMTAVVGPNGCGKSNIIDAVRWVMGESSAKNLRGESMTDVIFNGATGRQPVGQASIELLFDNASGKLSGEYAAFSEISIKRKVTREGTSQYYLNGSKCRRRDVTDIFLGTGMGPRSYAIIEQGMIARLIESKPEELRVYLEEAAGISKYKERRRETENRMRRTQENLDRLLDIREELGKQLAHLKRQANAAERYAEYKKEERLLSAKLHFIYWKLLDTDLGSKSSLATQFEQEIETAVLAKNSNENTIDALKTKLEDKQEIFNKYQAKYYQSGAEIATIEQKLKYEKTRQAEQSQQLARLVEELEELENVLAIDKQTLQLAIEDLETVSEEVLSFEEIAEESSIKLDEEESKLKLWQEKWDDFNRANANAQKTAELEQSKIQQCEKRLKDLELRHDRISKEKIELSQQIEELDLTQWEEEQLMVDERLLAVQLDIDSLLPLIDKEQDNIEELVEKRALCLEQISEKKAVQASLVTLQKSLVENDDQGHETWLKEQGLDSFPRLFEAIDVDSKWELAVQHVLSDWLDAIVVESTHENASVSMISDCSQSLTIIEKSGQLELVVSSDRLSSAVKGGAALNHFLDNIFIVETQVELEQKLIDLNEEQSVIMPTGLWASKRWIKYYKPDEIASGALSRSKQIETLQNEIPVLERTLSDVEVSIESSKEILHQHKAILVEKEALIKTATQDKTKLAALHGADQAKFDQFQVRLRRGDEELAELLENLDITREELAESRQIWHESLSSLEDFTIEKSEILDQRELQLESVENARRQARETQSKAHEKQLEKAQRFNQKTTIEQTISRLTNEYALKTEQKKQIASSDGIDSSEIEELSLTLEGLLETRLVAEEKLSEAKSDLENSSNKLREEESLRSKYEANISAAREKLETIRMDTQALAINKKNLEERISEDGFNAEKLSQQITDEDDETNLKNALQQLESKIQRLGSINLAAIDEFKVQSERKDHLDEQNNELEEALGTLTEAIKKIDRETRARFKETFDQVNEGLQRLFPKIFGGGNAYLELTDDNLLETGVMIIARPPGKKNATIHLLSGGEKSLTAIALIFAIFELNPAPFCMLDEVDAPLDDANVGRFANMVKEMSSQVQFIYISHNKVSMEKADQLMGVTMHEPGVSRLVSVDIDEAAALVEA